MSAYLQGIGILLDIVGVLIVWRATATFADKTQYNISWGEIRQSVKERRKLRREGRNPMTVSPIHVTPPSVEAIYWSRKIGVGGILLIVLGFVLQAAALIPLEALWTSISAVYWNFMGMRGLVGGTLAIAAVWVPLGVMARTFGSVHVVDVEFGNVSLEDAAYRQAGSPEKFQQIRIPFKAKLNTRGAGRVGPVFVYLDIDSNAPATSLDCGTWRMAPGASLREIESSFACVLSSGRHLSLECKLILTAIPTRGRGATRTIDVVARPGEVRASPQDERHSWGRILRHRLAVARHHWSGRPWWFRFNPNRHHRRLYEAIKYKRFEDRRGNDLQKA